MTTKGTRDEVPPRLRHRRPTGGGGYSGNRMIKTPQKKREGAGGRERERDDRGTRELSFYGWLVNYWPYNQPVPCTIQRKRARAREKEAEKKRHQRLRGEKKGGTSRESDTKREGFGAPRNKLTPVDVARRCPVNLVLTRV